MKSFFKVLIVFLVILIFQGCGGGGGDSSPAKSPTYTLTYSTGSNGHLTGSTTQTVNKESNGSAVTAVADSGYHFVKWSDNKTDNTRIDSNVQANITVGAVFAQDAVPTYTLTYSAGSNGHLTGSTTQTVNADVTVSAVFAQDEASGTTKPVITLLGNAEVRLVVGNSYTDAGATATDDTDGNITDKITITSNVNTTKEGSYTIKYDVLDLAGNHANSVIRHIKVVPKFKYIGPGNGGAMYGIAVDPFNSSHIITGGDMGVAFSTEDNGASWNIIGGESGKQPGAEGTWEVKADPSIKGTFWLAGGGVFKSTDGAKTWKRMSVGSGPYGAIGIDPTDSDNVYVAQGYVAKGILSYSHGTVYHTTDGGLTWTKLLRPGGEDEKKDTYHRTYSSLAVDDTYVYLSGRGGIWRHDRSNDDTNPSSDGWTNIGANITGFNDKQGAEILLVKDKLVATVSPVIGQDAAGVYISSDHGDSWEQKIGTVDHNLSALIQVTKNRNKKIDNKYIYPFVLAHSTNSNRLYLGSHDALAKSDDMGETWEMLTPLGDYDTFSSYFYNLATDWHDSISVVTGVNGFKHAIWGNMDIIHRMTVDPNNEDIVYFSDNQDLYRSTDAGVTWNSITFDYVNQFVDFDMKSNKKGNDITAKNRYEWSTKTRGIQDIVAESVAVAPDNSNIIYVAYMDLGLEISRDNGKTWEHPTLQSQDTKVSRKNFLPPRGHTWALATDKDNPKDVYVSRMDGNLYKSSDYGKSWKRIFNRVDENNTYNFHKVGRIGSIAIDTNTTIYMATLLDGVLKTTDGGESWTNINNGLDSLSTNVIKIDPNNHNTLYIGTRNGLFKTTDAGSSWQNILKDDPSFDNNSSFEVKDISIAQTNPTVVYANIYKKNSHGSWGFSGVWQLKDNNWTQINPTKDSERGLSNHILPYIGGIAVNPYNSNYIYTCARQVESNRNDQANALLRSKDGGETWENFIGEVPYARCTKITIDPTDPHRVFVNMAFGVLQYFDAEAPTTNGVR